MENSRDSSVWRSLAVALGDGLAFGVGMALSQKAARRDAASPPGIDASGDRLQDLERRMALLEKAPVRVDPKVLETIVGAFEADLRDRDEQWSRRVAAAVESAAAALRQEHAEAAAVQSRQVADEHRERDAQWRQRLAAIESAVAGLRQEHADAITTVRQDVVADLRTLESPGLAFQQEITEAIPRVIDEKIAGALGAASLDAAIDRKVEALRIEIADREREIADLRERLAASDQRTADLLAAIGLACREAAERANTPPPGRSEPAPSEPAPKPTAESAETAPRFAVESSPTWSLPLVSSLLVASGCFACLHWL